MSLYREVGRGRPARVALLVVLGLLAGGAVGFAVGKSDTEEPSLPDAIERLRTDMGTASRSLELVTIEYPEAVRGGRVVAPTEYGAVRSHLAETRSVIAQGAADLDLLDPAAAEDLDRSLTELGNLVGRRAPPDDVRRAAETGIRSLRRALRLPG